jgi:hypothetical protein
VGTNPDLQAELQRVADKTGVPVSTVAANPEEMKRQAAVGSVDFQGLAATAPATARLLANIDNAKIAHDDVGTLTQIEQAVRSFLNPDPTRNNVKPTAKILRSSEFGALVQDIQAKNPGLGFDEARALASQMATVDNQSTLIGVPTPPKPTLASIIHGIFNPAQFQAMDAGLSIAAADALGLDPSRGIRDYEVAQARIANATPDFETRTGSGLYQGGVSIVQNAPGIALSVLSGSPIPGLALAGGQTGAQAYGKYRDRGATPGQAALGATLEGGLEVGTELMPMSFLVQKLGKAGAGEFLRGLLARELPSEQVATITQDAVDTAIANPDKTWTQYLAERPGAAYETLLATLVQAGLTEGSHVVLEHTAMRAQAEAYQAQQAEHQSQMVQQVMQAAAASKLRERDAGTFEGFMQAATQDGPLEKLYINPQPNCRRRAWTSPRWPRWPRASRRRSQQALQTGTDVAIPTSELATRLPGTPLEQPLLDHLKTDPGGFSRVGAQEYLQTQGEAMRQEVEKQLAEHQADTAFKESMRAVEDDVRQQLPQPSASPRT